MPTIKTVSLKYLKNTPSLDGDILLSWSIKKPKEFVLIHPEYKLSLHEMLRFFYASKKYQHGLPIAYITHHKEFFGLDFFVNRHTLIPRPDTELMVEEVIKEIKNSSLDITGSWLIDVGTGSGCIPIAIAKNIKEIKIVATDISTGALKIARKNARTHNVSIEFLHGNLLEPVIKLFKSFPTNSELIITANLPYLTKEQFQNEPSIQHEPYQALVADENGLALYKELLQQITQLLLPTIQKNKIKITCFFEIDPSQALTITKLIHSFFPTTAVEIKKDLAKRDRLVVTHLS